MDKVQKIREEIEKKLEIMQYQVHRKDTYKELKDVLAYIDSLQEEPKFKTGDRIKPIDSCLGSPRTIVDICDSWYVTDQGTLDFEYEDNWELVEEPVNEELEKAAKRYATEGDEISGLHIIDEEVDAFKAGAKWQKEQMTAKAFDGEILEVEDNDCAICSHTHLELCIEPDTLEKNGFKDNDKVKIIVIKEK